LQGIREVAFLCLGQEAVQDGIFTQMLSTTYLHDCKTVMDSIYILRDAALGRGASKLQHISEVEILNRVPDAQHNKDHWDAQQPHLNRLEPQTLHLNL